MVRPRTGGFTLIELLVVITIIVVLLALLTPALDKAIYSAELTACGATMRGVASGNLVYAADNKRRYASRGGIDTPDSAYPYFPPTLQQAPFDDRPHLTPYTGINSIQCPLTDKVDQTTQVSPPTRIFSSYRLWWGWRYNGYKGMFKIGDRFTWATPEDGPVKFSVLVTDTDAVSTGFIYTSHPDKDGKLQLVTWQDEKLGGVQVMGLAAGNDQITMSTYRGMDRGAIDLNFAYDDGSVKRLEEVTMEEVHLARGESQRISWAPEDKDTSRDLRSTLPYQN